jgi:hypothetical protein
MKRIFVYCAALIGALGSVGLSAVDLSSVSLDARLGYESEYVARGRKWGQGNVQLSAEFKKSCLYGGITSIEMVKDTSLNMRTLEYFVRGTNVQAFNQESDSSNSYNGIVDQYLSFFDQYLSLAHEFDLYEMPPVRIFDRVLGAPLGSFSNVSPHVGCAFAVGQSAKIDLGYKARIYTNLHGYNFPAGIINFLIKTAQIAGTGEGRRRVSHEGEAPEASIEEPIVEYASSGDYASSRDYASSISVRHNSHEVYCGIQLGVLCNPSAYMFYDIANEEFALIASGAYSWNFSPRIDFEAKASITYDYRHLPVVERGFYVSSLNNEMSRFRTNEDYFYYSAEGVVAYRYNNNVTLKGRLSYCGNTAHKGDFTDVIFGGHHKNCVWLGGAVEVSF